MILVDSNIIIDFWKHPTEEMKEVFATGDVVICGVVRSEILHGAVSQENLDRLSKLLNAFDIVSIKDDQWDGFGRYLYKLKTNGLTVPYQDALISYIAVQNNVKVWTWDKHFKLFSIPTVLKEIIFEESKRIHKPRKPCVSGVFLCIKITHCER